VGPTAGVADPPCTPASTTPRKVPFPHAMSYWQGTPGVRMHGQPLLPDTTNDTVHAIQSALEPNSPPRKTYNHYAAGNRSTELMPHSAELLGEVRGKPPVTTTRNQLLLDAHAVNNHSTTVYGCSPCLDGLPVWRRIVNTVA
jgi:hypothetical protein